MASQGSSTQVPEETNNVFSGDHFDPAKWLIVPAKTFDDLKVGMCFGVLAAPLPPRIPLSFKRCLPIRTRGTTTPCTRRATICRLC